ncbi:MAG: PIN domain-containing protein [Campylobacterota bacterium]|nr:PIN domain-containing protein [Campylobacterota bacterium]
MTKVFLDANVLIDIIDASRPYSEQSSRLFTALVENIERYELFTSCDLMTTVYYILTKQIEKKEVLEQLKVLNQIITVVEFGNREIDEAISLMQRDKKFQDLEDTIQFIMARKSSCKYIITNDKNFFSHEIMLLNTNQALEHLL